MEKCTNNKKQINESTNKESSTTQKLYIQALVLL